MERRPWFKARPVDESFFDSAPLCLRGKFEVARPAPDLWAELTEPNPLGWCRIIQRIEWTSPRPFGVGTTRTVHSLWGTNVIRERFFRWQEGERKSFYVVETTAPLFRALAEDYLVEPTGPDSCRFTWTIAAEPNRLTGLANPINRRLLGTLLTDTGKHFSA